MDIVMGPVLFNWPAETWRDFWFRVADEAPVARAVVGEVVCSKRAPLYFDHLEEVIDRLRKGGKQVALASLAEVMSDVDRRAVAQLADMAELVEIEVNDISALAHLDRHAFSVGPFVNVYNERTLAYLAGRGAKRFALPPELPSASLALLSRAAREQGAATEVFAWGRAPLALSARCYHARAHGRTKDSCQYVCDEDPDGMEVKTLDGRAFLAVNGIQTLSHGCIDLSTAIDEVRATGVDALRLSPHSVDMVRVARIFADAASGDISGEEAHARLREAGLPLPAINGFFHHRPGHEWVA